MVNLIDIKKSYDTHNILNGININIKQGDVFGIIGINGVGKTTLLKIILNKTNFEGRVLIDGIPNYTYLKNNSNKIVYLPDTSFLYDFLTGIEFIMFIMDMQKIPFNKVKNKVDLLFKLFDLTDSKNQIIKEYSLGMKRKLSLITVLIQSPNILILDEPVTGVDIRSLIIFKKLLEKLSKNGTTIILTTHIIDLIENMCNSVAILH